MVEGSEPVPLTDFAFTYLTAVRDAVVRWCRSLEQQEVERKP